MLGKPEASVRPEVLVRETKVSLGAHATQKKKEKKEGKKERKEREKKSMQLFEFLKQVLQSTLAAEISSYYNGSCRTVSTHAATAFAERGEICRRTHGFRFRDVYDANAAARLCPQRTVP